MRILTQMFLVFLVICILGFLPTVSVADDTTNTDTTLSTDSVKVDNGMELVYKGFLYALGNIADMSKKGRQWAGVGFLQDDSPNIYTGQEWVVKELDIYGKDKLVGDFALGYAVAKINRTTSEDSVTINTDYKTALITGSIGLTWKPELDAWKLFTVKDTGASIWGGIDPNLEGDMGIQGHTNLTKLGGVELDKNTVQAWIIKGAIIALSIYAGQQ